MKSRKKLRKTSNRKKNKINRKKSRKIYKKVKYGGQDPPIPADKELNQRIKIGSFIDELRKKLKKNENDEALKNDIFMLIRVVYVYKNMSAPKLIFSNFDELYRERNYMFKDEFFEKYNDLNKLLDIIESDFNRAADDYKNKYLTIKKTESSSQLYNDNIDDNNLEEPLL
jgi:hypothetical protein